jgi:hypothetical protein
MPLSKFLLDNIRYILRELAYRCASKLEDYPASRQVLFFRVSYPLGLVLCSDCDCGHVEV